MSKSMQQAELHGYLSNESAEFHQRPGNQAVIAPFGLIEPLTEVCISFLSLLTQRYELSARVDQFLKIRNALESYQKCVYKMLHREASIYSFLKSQGVSFSPAHSGVLSTVTGERTNMLTSKYESVCLTCFWPSVIKSCLSSSSSEQTESNLLDYRRGLYVWVHY